MTTFNDYFSTQASDYAKYRPTYPEALFDYLAGLVTNHDAAWDCATGNGQVAVGLTPFFQTVYATDASADQITHAFPHPQIRYAVATAEASGLPSQSVDLVTVGLALHWLNLERFYQEVARVVKPGGAIAVWCTNIFQLPEATPAVQQLITELYEELIYPFRPPEIQIVEDRYQTIPFPFEEIPAPTLSRTALWTADRLMGYVSTWSATQRLIAAQGEGAIANFTDRLRAAWGDPNQPQPVHWQIYLRAGRVIP